MFEEHKQLLDELISVTKSLHVPRTNDIMKLFLVFRYRQLSLLESIQKLCNDEKWYEACILNTTLIENYFLQRWLVQHEKIVAYLEYACIESLPRVEFFKEETNQTLKFIREHNLISYFKKDVKQTDGNLLKQENYKKAPWQKISQVVQDLTKDNSNQEISCLYHDYNLLCGFKHSNAYAVLARWTNNAEQDGYLAYQITCITTICQLVFIDQCCNFKGLKEKLKSLYLKHLSLIQKSDEIKEYLKETQLL